MSGCDTSPDAGFFPSKLGRRQSSTSCSGGVVKVTRGFNAAGEDSRAASDVSPPWHMSRSPYFIHRSCARGSHFLFKFLKYFSASSREDQVFFLGKDIFTKLAPWAAWMSFSITGSIKTRDVRSRGCSSDKNALYVEGSVLCSYRSMVLLTYNCPAPRLCPIPTIGLGMLALN